MQSWLSKFILFLSFFLLFLIFPNSAWAQNFSTDYSVTYQVLQNTRTNVSFDVTLTNQTEQYYASSYSIQVGFSDIQNLIASDSQGAITPKLTKTGKGHSIELTFNDKITGFGNKLNFDISFDTSEIAQNLGTVWEVNIPGLSNQNDFSSFNVNVLYPSSLGRPTFIKPNNSYNSSPGRISFNKSNLTGGISMAFGEFQIYDFDLSYHIGNKNLFPIRTEIALPPTTNYQDVLIDEISPKPENVKIDPDGNWLAEYRLMPSQEMDIQVLGRAKIYLTPKQESLAEEDFAKYLVQEPYWQVNDVKIKELANKLKTPREIYQYVVDTLTYDFSRVINNSGRAGALGVLSVPASAVCLEFVDLFVAIARAAGIPAREIDGYANTRNPTERPLSLVKDILHAWPEYYDTEKKTWIMIDPTWGNTTGGVDYFDVLDFDHFAFVKKGLDSEYPVPAGGYKLAQDAGSKDVNVTFGKDFETKDEKKVEFLMADQFFPGSKVKGNIRVSNLGNSLVQGEEISIKSDMLSPQERKIVISKIPPQAFVDIPFEFPTEFLTNKEDTIRIGLGKNEYTKQILISPFFVNEISIGGVLILVTTTILISILAKRGWRLPLRRPGG